MKTLDVFNKIKELFLENFFEVCEESCGGEEFFLYLIKKDFRIEVDFDYSDHSFCLRLDRPSFAFQDEAVIKDLNHGINMTMSFIKKIDELILQDSTMLSLTKEDCELFLNTGNHDGMSQGVIEYRGSLYLIKSVTSPYYKHRPAEDSQNKVWRHFYVYPLTKEELESVVLSSLDWMRHINLSTLCKNWESVRCVDMGDKDEHQKYFKGKYYQMKNEIASLPIMKLTLHY